MRQRRQSAVMKSNVCTARSAYSPRPPIPITPTDFTGREHGKRLRGQLVPGQAAGLVLGVAQLFDEDRIGATQQFGVLVLDLAQDPHAQARPGNG